VNQDSERFFVGLGSSHVSSFITIFGIFSLMRCDHVMTFCRELQPDGVEEIFETGAQAAQL
jgi:hypothetical protein